MGYYKTNNDLTPLVLVILGFIIYVIRLFIKDRILQQKRRSKAIENARKEEESRQVELRRRARLNSTPKSDYKSIEDWLTLNEREIRDVPSNKSFLEWVFTNSIASFVMIFVVLFSLVMILVLISWLFD